MLPVEMKNPLFKEAKATLEDKQYVWDEYDEQQLDKHLQAEIHQDHRLLQAEINQDYRLRKAQTEKEYYEIFSEETEVVVEQDTEEDTCTPEPYLPGCWWNGYRFNCRSKTLNNITIHRYGDISINPKEKF